MARIKSALEIALERTQDIEVDTQAIARDRYMTEGKRLAGGFLSDVTRSPDEFLAAYAAYKGEQKDVVREGCIATVLANIALPQSEFYTEPAARVRVLVAALSSNNENALSLYDQIVGFYDQYLQIQKELVNRLKEQYQPALEQKQAAMRKQYGPNYTLKAEQDPEFLKLLEHNYKQLDAQYGQALEQARTQLKELMSA